MAEAIPTAHGVLLGKDGRPLPDALQLKGCMRTEKSLKMMLKAQKTSPHMKAKVADLTEQLEKCQRRIRMLRPIDETIAHLEHKLAQVEASHKKAEEEANEACKAFRLAEAKMKKEAQILTEIRTELAETQARKRRMAEVGQQKGPEQGPDMSRMLSELFAAAMQDPCSALMDVLLKNETLPEDMKQ